MTCHHHTLFGPVGAASLFMLGAVGSLHCLGMCGPLSGFFVLQGSKPWKGLVLYHAFRTLAYALLGAGLFLAGSPLRVALPWWALAVLVSLPLLFTAAFGELRLPEWMGRVHSALGRRLAPVPPLARAAGLGLASPVLPCGLLYATAGYSLAASSPVQAAGWMASFALGTVPLLALSQAGLALASRARGGAWTGALQRSMALLAALVILVFAFVK
jgi:uncharacterized protein